MIHKQPMRFGESVALMAMMTSLAAMSIDTILPALPEIGHALGVQEPNDNQLIIGALFLGLTFGQMFYGPLSDNIGRKPAIYLGFGLYGLGTLLCLFAFNFPMMLVGRVLQGIGVAGPRIVTVALVRDQYQGREMAQVMSFVMTVFILMPIVAPLFGQMIIMVASWRAIFGVYLILALITSIWFTLRQPETLPLSRRIPFSVERITAALREIFNNRQALGYTLAAGLISGAFIGYLNSAQQIFQVQYGVGELFPLYFATLAFSLGCASFMNGRLVMRYGMRALALLALRVMAGLSAIFLVVAYSWAGNPPLWLVMGYLLCSFFGVGILFGNMNALAMETLGHIAGMGAAVVGSLSTLISVVLGTLIGQSYNGTVLPLAAGFAILSLASIAMMTFADSGKPPMPVKL